MMHRDVKLKDVILRPCLGQCIILFICWGWEECSLYKVYWAKGKIDYEEKIAKKKKEQNKEKLEMLERKGRRKWVEQMD